MPKTTWQIKSAKSRFSALVQRAAKGEPQLLTKNNRPIVYVIEVATYEKKVRDSGLSTKAVLLSRPYKELEIDTSRIMESGRDITL
ncbi:MAG: type II toxin-antitoxin system prevent-host-death family antitoxin [Spirochaetes bacterium]|jgi:prevent-host-death family protein|nr:type II toxin-antitoxin system prevent-host-death family antitoxin [Spirochaetota bacterium]